MILDTVYLTVLFGLSGFGFHRLRLLYLSRKEDLESVSDSEQFEVHNHCPRVTIQLPIFNERHVATRLIDAACRIDYPRQHLEIQVLDDSTDDSRALIDEAVLRWQSVGIPIKTLRRTNRYGFKAGALAAGMQASSGELFAIFDADFVPPPSFLSRLIPYFDKPDVGMIQARWAHLNRHESLLTEAQAILLDGHFSIEQKARNQNGLWFNFNGTAGIWRRNCIEDAGGWAHETLTEDLDLSYRAQMRGWSFKYVDSFGVPAELPSDYNAFRSQQHRWAKGSVQVAKKLLSKVLFGQFPLETKFETACHLLANLNYLLVSVLCICVPPLVFLEAKNGLFSWIGSHVFLVGSLCFAAFYVGSQRCHQPIRRSILLLPVVFAIGLSLCLNNSRAVLEAIFNQISPFVRTPKLGDVDQRTVMKHSYASQSHLPLLHFENLMLVFYSGALLVSIHQGAWQHLPILLLFIAGFSSRYWSHLCLQSPLRLGVRSTR